MYYVVIIILILSALYLNTEGSYFEYGEGCVDINRKRFMMIFAFLIIILSGLRNKYVGMDTPNYENMYFSISDRSFSDIYNRFLSFSFLGTENTAEVGFLLIEKIFQTIGLSFQLFLVVIACGFTIPLSKWICKYSKRPLLSVMIYFCLFFSLYGTTALRQTIAMSIAFFGGQVCLRKNKVVPYILCCVIAATIHRTAIVLIPFYFISKVRWDKVKIGMSMVVIPIVFSLRGIFTSYLATLAGYERYSQYYDGAGTWTFSAMMLAILFLTFLYCNQLHEVSDENNYLISAQVMACVLLPISFVDPSNLRVIYYFAFNIILLVPELLEVMFNDRSKKLAELLCCFVLILLFAKNANHYYFFWQYCTYEMVYF